ncbi:AbfB domain-containing protein [Streptomyces olivochromogenes]|uniref:AbfB domain-containing protein n=1 Tax=Streptomyces olivochromogenes TaxID=1963 RepID=UPI001F2AA536|nr:AbfB domain-containing protein [Streptomyces olivochromogenes]MCF3133524.1 AbfB domain-containing protein [Streptomyces olivochromogenes]
MPENTPQAPRRQPWENGWAPDTSRAPGTRSIWLAGGLALATVVACVAAIAVSGQSPDEASAAPARTGAPTDDGPGLLSFASPSSGTTAAPADSESGLSSQAPLGSPSAASARDHGGAASTPSAGPSASSKDSGSHDGPGDGSGGGGGGSGDSKNTSARKSVRSVNYPDRYWHISGGYVQLDPVGSAGARRDAAFQLVKGLADAACYSFATGDGGYLRHRDFLLRAERDDGSRLFTQDATFCPRASAHAGAVMLESVNYPGRFLRHQNFRLKLDRYESSDLYRADSAFRLVDGLG